jgi:hypothetical protein
MYELKKNLEWYLRVNLLGPGPRLIKKNLPGRGLTKVEKDCSIVRGLPNPLRTNPLTQQARGILDRRKAAEMGIVPLRFRGEALMILTSGMKERFQTSMLTLLQILERDQSLISSTGRRLLQRTFICRLDNTPCNTRSDFCLPLVSDFWG